MAQDDYFYEIQLTNKQLVFYFLAGATGLILSFLAGVMVGRGVDQTASEVQAARPIQEERIVTEETPKPAPSAQDMTYAQRLEAEKSEERLERVKPSAEPAKPTPRPVVADAGPATTAPPPVTAAPRATPRPAATPPATAATASTGSFTLQVGAFKDRATAESMVGRLKGKGFAAFLVTPQEGLFNVRVGSFATRADAEKTQEQLRSQKFDPFVVKQ